MMQLKNGNNFLDQIAPISYGIAYTPQTLSWEG